MKTYPRFLSIAVLSLGAALPVISQTTYEWTSPSTGGNWSDFLNWTPTSGVGSTFPGSADTGNLLNATANRTIVYDASAPGTLATLNFTQTSAFSNILSVEKSLNVTNAITLGASGGGTSQLIVQPGTASVTLTAPSITVNSGGKLSLNAGTAQAIQPFIAGAVTVNGGTLEAQKGVGTAGAAYAANFNGALTITAGSTVNLFNVGSGNLADNRLAIAGNFTADLASGTFLMSGTLFNLSGATNVITNASASSTFGQQLVLIANTDQSLALSGSGYSVNQLWLRSAGNTVKTVGSGVGGQTLSMGNIVFSQNTQNTTNTLKLSSNVSQTAGKSVSIGQFNTTNAGYAIDVNGFTLDLSAANNTLTATSNAAGGKWTYTNTSGTAGTIRAGAFNLSGTNLTNSTVDNNITLEATGAFANNLGAPAGTIHAGSRFRYTGSSTAATITSNRTIGAFSVSNGTIKIVTAALTVAGDATIGDTTTAGTLDLGGQNLVLSGAAKLSGRGTITDSVGAGTVSFASGATGGLAVGNSGVGTLTFSGTMGGLDLTNASLSTFDIASLSSFDSVALGSRSATLGGALSLNFLGGYTPTIGDTYALFTTSGSISSSFTSITSNVTGFDYAFNNATGVLTVTSSIPEPSTYAGLAGLGVLALAAYRRRSCRTLS
ncbi:MAG TPA: PEP-CTERM sorting domain-containing protein [Rariglobus sp.]|nr:PEP-CTERM sorting domain-containing protein [Rariglobus sp.]